MSTVPLEARTLPWMDQVINDPQLVRTLIDEYGSPVNLLNPAPLRDNANELISAGKAAGVEVGIFFARKANKALAFVDAARDAGLGVDVASLRELQQVLERGVNPQRVILSAAIKDAALIDYAVQAGVVISCDNVTELTRISRSAQARQTTAHIAPRLAPDPALLAPTRFGELLSTWRGTEVPSGIDVVGTHIHLHGYSEKDRRQALAEALVLVDHYKENNHPVSFIDIGGGIPMSYLKDVKQWEYFNEQLALQRAGKREPFTWKGDPLINTYPFWQRPVRGEWLTQLLSGEVHGFGTAAAALRARGLRLHLEPGRSLLDGCGMILSRVEFTKQRSDGLDLVGLAMNRTQCRTAADDILLDPILIPTGDGPRRDMTGYLVGAYCIEDEVIIRREMQLTVAPGDTVAIVNTAGYFMHILESASHQIPLAKNIVRHANNTWVLDAIDSHS
ncbi:Y4yA family PLP-dependent enzyme [Corynebacterium sp. ES2794-CONJ1]|uniref:Y4yA family PLP-dependent enzyme n=1 Tax=Corynebacterium sp. ES2794-CONJ1 TaxID=2980553 RepID=UPI0021DB3177|nr:Y4yA family PLP-dependent enzyme [Corynebacterium sp. ES2794-CONJ1]MCU9519710.1 Y4yA family PLP-dependent enzyme [Corynebacterium sp. ES2794-CONJ1]